MEYNSNNEIWAPVEGFKGYEVSTAGRVRRGDRIIKPYLADGYERVVLYQNGGKYFRMVHQLVGAAFLPITDTRKFVIHKDGNKANNKVENLTRDCTSVMGWKNNRERVEAAAARAWVMSNRLRRPIRNVETGEVFDSAANAARHYKLYPQSIGSAARGEYKTAGGYHWEYLDGEL